MAHTAFKPTLTPLSNHFGVEVEGIDLTKLTTQEQFQRHCQNKPTCPTGC